MKPKKTEADCGTCKHGINETERIDRDYYEVICNGCRLPCPRFDGKDTCFDYEEIEETVWD